MCALRLAMDETGTWRHIVVVSLPRPRQRTGADRTMDDNLHSPQRRLIELRIEHADLDSLIDAMALQSPMDDLVLRRLKKRRLLLRDQIVQLETQLEPPEPA
jgi:hypothetical protein